jgi:hypothetical protein
LRNISPTLIELQIANRIQSVPKKSKTGQGAASNGSSDLKRKRRSTSAAKSTGAAKKKPAAKVKAVKSSKPVPAIEPTDNEIRLRAYFIAERRSRLALPGDSNTDWLEARRQLLSELSPR